MKHESEYNTINGLAVGDDMDADAFNVVSGLDEGNVEMFIYPK